LIPNVAEVHLGIGTLTHNDISKCASDIGSREIEISAEKLVASKREYTECHRETPDKIRPLRIERKRRLAADGFFNGVM
jgi:hypothetical protein